MIDIAVQRAIALGRQVDALKDELLMSGAMPNEFEVKLQINSNGRRFGMIAVI